MAIDKETPVEQVQKLLGHIKIDTTMEYAMVNQNNEEDFWLTQKSMSKLFNVAENNITYHLQNIFKTRELEQDSVTQKIRVTASDGKKYNTNFYSLDAIIAVGYRVNSKEATDFRIWATKTLKEYIKKGFVVNSEMLKKWS